MKVLTTKCGVNGMKRVMVTINHVFILGRLPAHIMESQHISSKLWCFYNKKLLILKTYC